MTRDEQLVHPTVRSWIARIGRDEFDFVALEKIGIIMVGARSPLQHHDGTALLLEEPQHFLEGAFVHMTHPEEMRPAVVEALRDNAQRRARVRQYRDAFFVGLDGQASHRIKAIIERLLAEGGHANGP